MAFIFRSLSFSLSYTTLSFSPTGVVLLTSYHDSACAERSSRTRSTSERVGDKEARNLERLRPFPRSTRSPTTDTNTHTHTSTRTHTHTYIHTHTHTQCLPSLDCVGRPSLENENVSVFSRSPSVYQCASLCGTTHGTECSRDPSERNKGGGGGEWKRWRYLRCRDKMAPLELTGSYETTTPDFSMCVYAHVRSTTYLCLCLSVCMWVFEGPATSAPIRVCL